MSLQTKYFLLAVIIIGSIGIWLPILVEYLMTDKIDKHNIPPNITTYFVSILFAGSIDYFLGKITQLSLQGIASVFLNLIMLIILTLALVLIAVILNAHEKDNAALLVGIIGILVAFRIWWIANINNPNFFPKPESSLGNDPSKPLTNDAR